MPTAQLFTDDLLDPISDEQPAGVDLRWAPEWDRIREARRSDDSLESGKWARKEQKSADWRLTRELATSLLRDRSKDLQLAMWLTEADLQLHGFPGLRDGLRVARELMVRYWDRGLFPAMEDGPEDRAGPLQWLNDKLTDVVRAIPITVRDDGGTDYSLIDVEDARRVGSEANFRDSDGEIVDEQKKKNYDQALRDGHVSMEMFERAVKATKRADYEEFSSDFHQACEEYRALEKAIDEKFGDAPPQLSAFRTALADIQQEVSNILEVRRKAEPDRPSVPDAHMGGPVHGGSASFSAANPVIVRLPLTLPESVAVPAGAAGSWQEAEAMIRSGQVEYGLAEMTRLAANETSGRNRFQRKLLLAEVCLASRRERLARSILEELAEQIDKFQLELWESSELVGSVWTRLYRLYKQGAESADSDRAEKLYDRLCRLDPWQALGCGEE